MLIVSSVGFREEEKRPCFFVALSHDASAEQVEQEADSGAVLLHIIYSREQLADLLQEITSHNRFAARFTEDQFHILKGYLSRDFPGKSQKEPQKLDGADVRARNFFADLEN